VNAATWVQELKSGPGWTRLLEQRGAQVLVAVLLAGLAIECALILTRALSQTALPPPAAGSARAAPVRPATNPTVELANIVNAHLFGVAGVQAGGSAPNTTAPLILAGVIADKDPAKGQAIIGDSATAAKLVAVGATIPGGARLNSVYGDHVLIERGGRLETLRLPRTPMKSAPPPSNQLPGTQTRTTSLNDNATVLAGLVRVQPVFNQGKLSGYRIFPGGTHGTSAFNQLGLRAGDLITAINGTALDDAGRAMEVMQTLSSSASAEVTVSRNGASQDLNLNLATLNTELDTPPADNSAAGGANQPGAAGAGGPAQMRGRGGFPALPAAGAPAAAPAGPNAGSADASGTPPAPAPADGPAAAN
jgi:general secretion pathway protein C